MSSNGAGSPDKSEGSKSQGRQQSPNAKKPFVLQEDSFEPNFEGMLDLQQHNSAEIPSSTFRSNLIKHFNNDANQIIEEESREETTSVITHSRMAPDELASIVEDAYYSRAVMKQPSQIDQASIDFRRRFQIQDTEHDESFSKGETYQFGDNDAKEGKSISTSFHNIETPTRSKKAEYNLANESERSFQISSAKIQRR